MEVKSGNREIAAMLRRRARQTAKSLTWNTNGLILAFFALASTVIAALNSEYLVLVALVALAGLAILWAYSAWRARRVETESFEEETRIVAAMLSGQHQDDDGAIDDRALLTSARSTLSGREVQVLQEAARGKSNKEIATALDITQQTVKNHFSHVFRKLNVTDRTMAVMIARENGWLDSETGDAGTASEAKHALAGRP